MRVCHVITRLIVGGAQENTIASVLGLREQGGFHVSLIAGPTTGPEGSLEPRVAGIPGLLVLEPALVRPVHPWKDLLGWRRLTSHFRRLRPDLVHTHSGKAGILGRFAARSARVPLVVHGIHGPSFGPWQGTAANRLFTTAERRAARCTTHFVTVADAMKEQYLAAGIGRPEQFTRIFSGFDLNPYLQATNAPAVRSALGLEAEDLVIGKIARLFRLKGHDDLLDAAPAIVRACPRARFLLVGDGLWRDRLETRARGLGLERHFVFSGLRPPEEIPTLVGVMDVLVHLSRREGLARALPQAMAAGKPVVSWDCDGAREVCREDETGFLLHPGDVAGLVDVLTRLAGDAGLRARLGGRGRALVRESFSVERMVAELAGLYHRLAAAAGMEP
ncbi:MAG: glycosyltransferase family 4 protein [Verrucomicrobiales bacterium]|nr:glycosyltransferase family 4 protein [Verrucomicrobiales bacterium]